MQHGYLMNSSLSLSNIGSRNHERMKMITPKRLRIVKIRPGLSLSSNPPVRIANTRPPQVKHPQEINYKSAAPLFISNFY